MSNAKAKEKKCVQCGKMFLVSQDRYEKNYSPFCSRQCAYLDLGQWLNEGYSIAVSEDSDDGDYRNA